MVGREGEPANIPPFLMFRSIENLCCYPFLAGFSGAELANVVNEAALLAGRAGKDAIELGELAEGVQRTKCAPLRRFRDLSYQSGPCLPADDASCRHITCVIASIEPPAHHAHDLQSSSDCTLCKSCLCAVHFSCFCGFQPTMQSQSKRSVTTI